jgi:hypothetical protein
MTDEWGDEEVRRDRHGIARNWQGRPYILANPDWSVKERRDRGFKKHAAEPLGFSRMYTRCTTYVGCMEDTYSLGKWQERMVVTGMAFDESLLYAAQSVNYAGDESEVRDELDKIAEDAKNAAKYKLKATKGTAFHNVIEVFDKTGSAPPAASRDIRALLDAYARVTEGWEYFAIEQFMVNDDLEVGGTPDRIRVLPSGRLRIADLKTGGNDLKYGRPKMELQLAMYAVSKAYDKETGIRTDLDIDLEFAEIVHCPMGTDKGVVYKVPIGPAIEEFETVKRVRAWRSHKTDWPAYGEVPTLGATNEAFSAQAAAWPAVAPQGT